MLRPAPRALVALAVAALACSTPTDVCGCSPARSVVVVVGTVADSAGTPLAGARLYFDGVPPALAQSVPLYVSRPADAQSDAAGAFRAEVYSLASPGVQELRVAVVRAGLADTIRMTAGPARFRSEAAVRDTVRVALRLP